MNKTIHDDFLGTYEEKHQGFEIYIEHNRDSYRGGFEWSICTEESEINSGLSFTAQDSLDEAYKAINTILKKQEPNR